MGRGTDDSDARRYLDALFYAIDGNYHQHQRKKPLDPNDFPMTMGAAYFANEKDFRKYVAIRGEVEPEVGRKPH